jgi:uncharacterized RDD family membrane protein YckC
VPKGTIDDSPQVIEDNAEYQLILPKDEMSVGKAPVSKRFIAFLIDMFVVFTIFIVPFITVFSMSSGIVSTDLVSIEQFVYENFGILATLEISFDFIILFYFTVSEGTLGYTLGKRVFNLNVGKVTYGQAITRNITKAFFFTIPYIALADLIWMFFASDRRRLTEVISRTKVLYEPKLEVEYKWQGEF